MLPPRRDTLAAKRLAMMLGNNHGGTLDLNYAACSATISTPVDTTITIPGYLTYCSTGAIEIDSVAAGDGIVDINGAWRLT